MAEKTLKPGEKLDNGAIIILECVNQVLCVIPGNEFTPFVTWQVNAKNEAFWGHYFSDLEEAIADFKDRSFNLALKGFIKEQGGI